MSAPSHVSYKAQGVCSEQMGTFKYLLYIPNRRTGFLTIIVTGKANSTMKSNHRGVLVQENIEVEGQLHNMQVTPYALFPVTKMPRHLGHYSKPGTPVHSEAPHSFHWLVSISGTIFLQSSFRKQRITIS